MVKLYKPVMQAELFPMTEKELRQMLQRLEAKWNSDNIGDAHEIVKLDKQIKELRKRLYAMKA